MGDADKGHNGLGYRWENAAKAVRRAMKACQNAGYEPDDHFRESTKLIVGGKGATQKVKDWQLSRYACYLVAMNSDPDKPDVADAQTYFAVRTRQDVVPVGAFSLRGLPAATPLRLI
jgi:DNA-damage-inducible protein D